MVLLKMKCIHLVLLIFLVGCSLTPSPRDRMANAVHLAEEHSWHLIKLSADRFTLVAFVPGKVQVVETLSVYIEGDGLAWVSRTAPSVNPTPIYPIGLELALKQPRGLAVYLARPCQYVEGAEADLCVKTHWTDGRFSPAMIELTNQAVDQLKQRFSASDVELVGYSGGGAIAALLASQRKDVRRLITVAGNLDHQLWTTLHKTAPLGKSLNPADVWEELLGIPQIHFVGENDKIVPACIAESFQAKFPMGQRPEARIIKGADHHCCWVELWPILYPIDARR